MAPEPGTKTTGTYYTIEEVAWIALNYFNAPLVKIDKFVTLPNIVAIAMAESGGNTKAHNVGPTDDSYGLWQINMKGRLGPERRSKFRISADSALLDPRTNAQAAAIVYQEQGLNAWSVYPGKSKQYFKAAQKAVQNPQKPVGSKLPLEPIGGRLENTDGGGDNILEDMASALIDPVIAFFKEAGLRTAGFVGGAALLIGAIVIIAKRAS